jgi:DNA-binding NarL/FixJ family response regulator
MSPQSHTILTDALTAVKAEIAEVESRLAELTNTRETLESLLSDAPVKAPKAKVTKSTKKDDSTDTTDSPSTKRTAIIEALRAGDKPSDIAKAMDTNVGYVYTIRKSEGITTATESPAPKARKANGNGKSNGKSQADKIRALLKKGVSARDIADQLHTHVSYVYTVKNAA